MIQVLQGKQTQSRFLRKLPFLNKALQEELADMLPGPAEKEKIQEILERCKVAYRPALYKAELKRRVQELDVEGEEEPVSFIATSHSRTEHSEYQ